MTLGEKIKFSRKVKGLTQKELANMIGAKHNSVSDWENNKNKPDIDTVELLCGVLDISTDSIISSKEIQDNGDLVGTIMRDNDCLDMIRKYYELSLDDKNAVRQIISSLSQGRG